MLMAERSGVTEGLDGVLADLRALSGDIESCAVLSGDRELLSSSHASAVDRGRIGGLLAALMDLSDRTARESGKDYASQLRVDTEDGHLLLVRLEGDGILAATTGQEA